MKKEIQVNMGREIFGYARAAGHKISNYQRTPNGDTVKFDGEKKKMRDVVAFLRESYSFIKHGAEVAL